MKYSTILIILTVLLIAAKLTFWQSLSWWWVFAPIYGPIVGAIVIILSLMLIAASADISNTEDLYQ